MPFRILLAAFCLNCLCGFSVVGAQSSGVMDFDRQIAPLLARHCLNCHGADEPKGGLNLSTHQTAVAGGESGMVLVPGKPDDSLVWQYVESDQMPPKKPLTADEKVLLKKWIAGGAVWGSDTIDPFRYTTDARAGADWWALQPLRETSFPSQLSSEWIRNPIDRFILARLHTAGLQPAGEADRHTLLRRLSFDLTGLPPTVEQMDEFLQNESDQAYEHLVDRLLQSPHYGERWARHWLDIVRFGESNGYEYDQPRDNAWPYRNWVIDAFNADMPYDQFVQWQLAGDLLRPEDPAAVAATGFLVAGPHNTTLPSNDIMRMSMAQDELEELVGIVGQTFLGLTVNCARCHDHKFDPISQREYYQFAAALAGVTHGEKTVTDPLTSDQQSRLRDIEARLQEIQERRQAMEAPVRQAILQERSAGILESPEVPLALATWEFDDLQDSRGSLHGTLHGSATLDQGSLVLNGKDAWLATQPLHVDLQARTLEAWVRLDSLDQRGGAVLSVQTLSGDAFDAIVFGERQAGHWMAGSNSFVRTQPFGGAAETEAAERFVHVAIVYDADGTITGYRDGQPYGRPYSSGGLHRMTAGESQILIGLRHSPAGGNRLLAGRVDRAQVYDRALSAEEIAVSARVADRLFVSAAQLISRMTEQQRTQHSQLLTEHAALVEERESLVKSQQRTLYTCVSTDPGVNRLLRRGDVTSPGEVVEPSGLSAVRGLNADFGLPADAPDAARRQRLADWVTSSDNPLFARVMMNRLWQYHFGRGLVTTSSDFGFSGGHPSHPELLEWLARRFQQEGYSLKAMHRLMVTSSTWRQSAAFNEQAAQKDADNRWLWRRTPLRLTAEEIRDAGLVFGEGLDSEVGGVGYRDVRHVQFKGSNFYESIPEDQAAARRRTIYRFAPRGGRNPFLDTFDCPDPSVTTPARAFTTTPLQALALMNNDLVFQLADNFAARVVKDTPKDPDQQISRVCRIAFGRAATAEEIHSARPFVNAYGLAAFCRVVLNSNEFLYVR